MTETRAIERARLEAAIRTSESKRAAAVREGLPVLWGVRSNTAAPPERWYRYEEDARAEFAAQPRGAEVVLYRLDGGGRATHGLGTL